MSKTIQALIYLLDADAMYLKIAEKMLSERHITKCFQTKEALLEALKQQSPNLILVDSFLSKEDLYQSFRNLEEQYGIAIPPVIMMVVEGDVTGISEQLKDYVVDYVTKPFHKNVFVPRIERLIEFEMIRSELQNSSSSEKSIVLTNQDENSMWPDLMEQDEASKDPSVELGHLPVHTPGAISVDYQVFKKIFEFVKNIQQRYDQEFHMAMITINVKNSEDYEAQLAKYCFSLTEAIQTSIRNVDIFTRANKDQYLILLMNAGAVNVNFVVDRIVNKFYKEYDRNDVELSYSINEI